MRWAKCASFFSFRTRREQRNSLAAATSAAYGSGVLECCLLRTTSALRPRRPLRFDFSGILTAEDAAGAEDGANEIGAAS